MDQDNTEKQRSKKGHNSNPAPSSGSGRGTCITVLLVIAILTAVVVFLIPSPIEPVVYSYPEPLPKLEGPLEPNEKLRKTEKLYEGQVIGPESIAVDSTGTLYSGLADGRIVKYEGDNVIEVARTGKPPCGTPDLEPTCGRPLGMRFDRYGANLIVADAYYGLLKVNVKAGTISTLVPTKPGVDEEPFRFINDLDIGRDGTIYFTDSSSKWDRRNNRYCILEGDATGRLMSYHPKTGELDVLIRDLHFANGVQISHEGDFVLVAETITSRILKYYTRGDDEGKVEVFAENLPGLPDNIRLSSTGGYWVAMAAVRKAPFSMMNILAPRPWARKLLAKLIPQEWIIKIVPKYGLLVELSEGGSIKRSFHDPGGHVIQSISEVHEENGVLYLGSYFAPFLGKLKL